MAAVIGANGEGPSSPLGIAPGETALAARVARESGWLLVGALIWLSRLLLPQLPAPPELDASWQQALSYALAHGIQFGRDLVFTFGPLGGIAHGRYQPELYWTQILLFEFLFKGLIAWRWAVAIRRWPSALDRSAFVLLVTLSALSSDPFYLATIVVIASLQLDDAPPSRSRFILDLLLLSAIGFIKFTYFALTLAVAILVMARFAARSRRAWLTALGLYVGCVLAVWTLCGQAPWNLPVYIFRSAVLASGYSEAQGHDGPIGEVVLGLVWIVLAILIAIVTVRTSVCRRERVLAAATVLAGSFIAFKSSFTDHEGHGITFFGYAGLAMCALRPPSDAASVRRLVLGCARAAALVLCLAGLSMRYKSTEEMLGHTTGECTQNLRIAVQGLGELPDLHGVLEHTRQNMGIRYGLPRIRAIVGQHEIDLIANAQSWLFLNGLNWKPRPVFQSYLTVTPGMMKLNEQFYSGADAPEFVLFDFATIDHRTSGLEDAGAVRALLRGYEPVAVERRLVLMRRLPAEARRARSQVVTLDERDILPGESVNLDSYPGRALCVRFDIDYSWLGKLRKFVFHAPITTLHLEYAGGNHVRTRLLPGMASSGLLLRPYPEGNEDWIRLYTRGVEKRVKAFSVFSTSAWDLFYAPRIHVVIERCDDLLPTPALDRERELAFGSFRTPPSFTAGTQARNEVVEGREVVLVGPDARVVFLLAPGVHTLSGGMGFMPECLDRSDGVDFTITRVSKDGRRAELLQRTLVPHDQATLHSDIALSFEAEAGDRLVLSTTNPPERNQEYDLAYWERIEIR